MPGFPDRDVRAPWSKRRIAPVMGTNGMVASAHPLISSTGARVLAAGGNAVDAAVAAALVGSVVMPQMCGLGGDLFAIVHDPRRSKPVAYMGSGIAPRGLSYEDMLKRSPGNNLMPEQGPVAIGVPGMVRGYDDLLKNHGTRPFAELAEPAIDYASNGHPAAFDLSEHLLPEVDLLKQFPASSAVFLPGGNPIRIGSRFVQSDLGNTIRRLAEVGLDDFYSGEIAVRIATGLQEVGGVMSVDDLAQHTTDIREPLAIPYRGHTIYQTALPSQGVIHLEAMRICEQLLVPERFWTADWIHTQIEAIKIAFADRLRYAQDPRTSPSLESALLDDAWIARRAATIRPLAADRIDVPAMQGGDTTYLCVADGSGMMVSLIQSVSNAFGSGVVAGDTGVVMNNRVGRGFTLDPTSPNVYAPGKRTVHTLIAFSIADPDGRPIIVGGTPGGDGQPQWDLQMSSALIDTPFDVQAIADMPRWTVWPGTDPTGQGNPFEVRLEAAFPDDIRAELGARGHRISEPRWWHGAAQIISRDPGTGVLVGGSDSRVEGQAIAL
jgi:gamma-glutamyltranspeptidase/glutathione hydrolase